MPKIPETNIATMKGYAIIGPVSPWDEKYRDSIELFNAKLTFAETAGEAWRLQTRTSQTPIDPQEQSRRVQHWHNCGYRLVKAELTIIKETDDE